MPELDGKIVIITGASSGIGEATARRLAKNGATVALLARRKATLDKIAKEINADGGVAEAYEADITDKATAKRTVDAIFKKHGRIDGLVNNAGVMLNGPAMDAPLKEWELMIQLNLLGLLYMTHATLPHFREQGNGHLINLSSVAGRTTKPGSAVYNMTKWGVNAFTDALRQEIAEAKLAVRTTLIEPGAVDTELQSHLRKEVFEGWKKTFGNMKILEADDIARAIEYALVQPDHVNVNEMLVRPTEQAG